MTAMEEILTDDSARATQFMLWAGRLKRAAINIQKAYSLACGITAAEAPKERSSGSIKRRPPRQRRAPIPRDSPTTVVAVTLAPRLSLAPSCRPTKTAAPAAKMFSTDTMISSRGRVTPTAARARSEWSMPM